jgi:hypothetical protein
MRAGSRGLVISGRPYRVGPSAVAATQLASAGYHAPLSTADAQGIDLCERKRDSLHLIEEDLAVRFLESARIQRVRLALASKPYDVFFLCHVPTRNLNNGYNASSLEACEQAKTRWVQATSGRDEGVEAYKISAARATMTPSPNRNGHHSPSPKSSRRPWQAA